MSKPPDKPLRALIKKAVALRYQEDRTASVAATGRGKVAEEILALAREHGIPIKEDPDLVEVLARLDLDETLPPEVYLVAAEMLLFAYQANQGWRAVKTASPPS